MRFLIAERPTVFTEVVSIAEAFMEGDSMVEGTEDTADKA